jgi:hypothetical protein
MLVGKIKERYMAAMMDVQQTSGSYYVPIGSGASVVNYASDNRPSTIGFPYVHEIVVAAPLPPTHEKSRNVNFKRLYSHLISYLSLEPGWDGYDGEPASTQSMVDAFWFLKSLPSRFEAPIPMLAGDGEISLFWESDTHYLEASFPGDGSYHYIYNAPNHRFASEDLSLGADGLNELFLQQLRKV